MCLENPSWTISQVATTKQVSLYITKETSLGIVDKSTHNFDCPKCGTQETVTILQTGSQWGASWQSPPEAKLFTISWNQDTLGEPLPYLYECLACRINGLPE